tara:strand:+ start:53 stop:358 length:306 start_codon:yes stop_codon:yes gene_type:complete
MKIVLMMMATLILISCANKPIIDSRGGSGNIPRDAVRVHDDMYTCKAIAEEHTNPIIESSKKVYNLTRARLLWIVPKAEDKYKKIYERCLEARGHAVLTWE